MNGRWKLDSFSNHLSAHADLTADDKAAIRNLPCELKVFRQSSCIIHEAGSTERCAVLVAGHAFQQRLSGAGHSKIVALKFKGEMLASQSVFLDQINYSVFALTDAEVAFVDRERLVHLIQANSRINHAFHVRMAIEASILGEWILNMAQRDGRTRIAHFLCEWAIRTCADHVTPQMELSLPFTQEQIGNTVGLNAGQVSHILGQLQAEGLIKRGRRRVALTSWQALRAVGEFDERYLHRRSTPAYSPEPSRIATAPTIAMAGAS
jgi:CRP-like cAMP-binding protein